MDTIKQISGKLPDCHVIISSLLPRNDDLDQRVTAINESLEKTLPTRCNVTFVKHQNIKRDHLKDKKTFEQLWSQMLCPKLKAYFLQEYKQSEKEFPKKETYPASQISSPIPTCNSTSNNHSLTNHLTSIDQRSLLENSNQSKTKFL